MSTNLRPPALAERWGTTTGHLANWRSSGLGPAYAKLNGTTVLYPLSEVEAYERAHTVQTLDSIRLHRGPVAA